MDATEALIMDLLTPCDTAAALMPDGGTWPDGPVRLAPMDPVQLGRATAYARSRIDTLTHHLGRSRVLLDALDPGPGKRGVSRGSATWWGAAVPYYGEFDIRMTESCTEVIYFGVDDRPILNADPGEFRRYRHKFPMVRFDIKGYCIGVGARFERRVPDVRDARRIAVTEFAEGLRAHVEEIDPDDVVNVAAARLRREMKTLSKFVADLEARRAVSVPGWVIAEIDRPNREEARARRITEVVADDLGEALSVTLGRTDLGIETEGGTITISGPAEFLVDGRPVALWPRPDGRDLVDMIRESRVSKIERIDDEIFVRLGCHSIAIGNGEAHFAFEPRPAPGRRP